MTEDSFELITPAYNRAFTYGKLRLGLVVPIESHPNDPVPSMQRHLEKVQLAEHLGFCSVWLRDVPFNVPSFGDAGQCFDPFVYLGYLAAGTQTIGLGVASIILPLRHPAHVAKSAATADQLSRGRLLLGVASGDRPEEYPALGMSFHDRGQRFRESYEYIRAMATRYPAIDNAHGKLNGAIDMLPKPVNDRLPLLITGASEQSPDWLAANGDGWITYPRRVEIQERIIRVWRENTAQSGRSPQPAVQSLYIDLVKDDIPPQPIHLGFRSGINYLRTHLRALETIGINHVALNLRLNNADLESTLERISAELIPEFTD